jgi:sugar/nucleoside kinase (ribokinase family)
VAGFLADSGGCAAHTATALAWLGVSAGVIGNVGGDIFGDFIVQDLTGKGLHAAGSSRSRLHGTLMTVILSAPRIPDNALTADEMRS